jgi:[protein-PII] uridylyltransferase
VQGRLDAATLLARVARGPTWGERRLPVVPTEVSVDNAASKRFTVVDVFTRDRIGLLHVIARTLAEQGLTIAISKIGTEGARATDVFYVADAAGGKVSDPQRLSRLSLVLREALARFHEDASTPKETA